MRDTKDTYGSIKNSVENSANDGHYNGVSFDIDLTKLSVSRRRSHDKKDQN